MAAAVGGLFENRQPADVLHGRAFPESAEPSFYLFGRRTDCGYVATAFVLIARIDFAGRRWSREDSIALPENVIVAEFLQRHGLEGTRVVFVDERFQCIQRRRGQGCRVMHECPGAFFAVRIEKIGDGEMSAMPLHVAEAFSV